MTLTKHYFDIETGPLPAELLAKQMPAFDPPGNLKDPDKIKAAIEAKQQDWLSSAALRATTGRVLAVAWAVDADPPEVDTTCDEPTLLLDTVNRLRACLDCGGSVYSWNGHGFDLPFILQRCAVHGMPAHQRLMQSFRGRWSWDERLIDAMTVWAGPYNRHDGCSLKAVASALGVGEKSGNGADFAKLLATDPIAAKQYAANDVELLRGIVTRMGI